MRGVILVRKHPSWPHWILRALGTMLVRVGTWEVYGPLQAISIALGVRRAQKTNCMRPRDVLNATASIPAKILYLTFNKKCCVRARIVVLTSMVNWPMEKLPLAMERVLVGILTFLGRVIYCALDKIRVIAWTFPMAILRVPTLRMKNATALFEPMNTT